MSTPTILNGIREIRASLPTLTDKQLGALSNELCIESILIHALCREVDGYRSGIDEAKPPDLEDNQMIADRSVPPSAG